MKNFSFWRNHSLSCSYLRNRVAEIKKVIILINDPKVLEKSHFDSKINEYREKILRIINQRVDFRGEKTTPVFGNVTSVKVVTTARDLMEEIICDSSNKAVFIGDEYYTVRCEKENGISLFFGKTETSFGDLLNILACPSVKFVYGLQASHGFTEKEKTLAHLVEDKYYGEFSNVFHPDYNAEYIYTLEDGEKTFLVEIGAGRDILDKAACILASQK